MSASSTPQMLAPDGTENTQQEWLQRYQASLLPVFGTPQRVLGRGEGAQLWDVAGKEYLDLLAGIAVNSLGHNHPVLTAAITQQWHSLGHISNFFTSEPAIQLAERLRQLVRESFSDYPGSPEQSEQESAVFFSNSGAEALETALKIARKYGNEHGKSRILALEGAFHGRTLGALSLTAKAAYRDPFVPLLPGVEHLAFGDVTSLEQALKAGDVAALVLEPIQGEYGVRPLPDGYLQAARRLTQEYGALLIADEVQTGIGRTGAWFAYPAQSVPAQSADDAAAPNTIAPPDIITLAKGLGGGYPIGATITLGPLATGALGPGSHGSTFGGNPPAAAAALAVLEVIEAEGLLEHVQGLGRWFSQQLRGIDGIVEVRGAGLLLGVELEQPQGIEAAIAPVVVAAALDAGFILNAPQPTTLRLAPPLIISQEQLQSFVQALPGVLQQAAAEKGTP